MLKWKIYQKYINKVLKNEETKFGKLWILYLKLISETLSAKLKSKDSNELTNVSIIQEEHI